VDVSFGSLQSTKLVSGLKVNHLAIFGSSSWLWYVYLWIQALHAKEEILHLWWLSNLIHCCERIWSYSRFLHDNSFLLSMLGCSCLLHIWFSFGLVLYYCGWSDEMLVGLNYCGFKHDFLFCCCASNDLALSIVASKQ
jgi:hypothetical protein